jgi:uncharacterized protein
MELCQFFATYPKVALAFSGGVDSAYLLYAAQVYGAEVRPYYVNSSFQPDFELRDGERLCSQLGYELTVVEVDILQVPQVQENSAQRCYYCKRALFQSIKNVAARDGYPILIDGTNASDASGDRPGMRAARELDVLSPLRLCGLEKAEIRRLSKEAGLFTWDKPAYSCLATRIPQDTPITESLLRAVEAAEQALMDLGIRDMRARVRDDLLLLQVPERDFPKILAQRALLMERIGPMFRELALDLKGR